MADSLDLFTGVLLTAIGIALVYGSIVYRLIDLILILGVIIAVFGLYKLLKVLVLRLGDSRSRSNPRLSNSSSNGSILKAGAKELTDFINGDDDKSKSKSVLRSREGSSLDSPNQMTFDEYMNRSNTDFDTDYTPKDVKPIFRDNSIDESKQVLKPREKKSEKSSFKLPSFKRKSSSKKPKTRNYGYLESDDIEQSPDKVYFTPNYEKPMKVSRKPKRKSENSINFDETPKRSKEISQALASVGDTETIYDNDVSDDSYSLMPKEMDEELIVPISEIDLDNPREPVYNLSQSENTSYNNVIYDEADGGDSDYFITPIHADDSSSMARSHGDSEKYEDDLATYLNSISSGESLELEEQLEDVSDDDEDDYITVEVYEDSDSPINRPNPRKKTDDQGLPRPTSIASTSPIAKKPAAKNLSRPAKKSKAPLPRPKAIPSPAKAEDKDVAENKGDTIQIDPNNPESLPIPKLLNSYVICEKGILTSQEAFEEVASHSKEEILLEAPTIKDMGERFLSSIANIKTRVIIQEFDIEDISYVLLLSSLIKKGVEIKTQPLVNSFNLIGDTSHALLISNSFDEDNFEYGAVYTDRESVENIKELFESSWQIAHDLDVNSLITEETLDEDAIEDSDNAVAEEESVEEAVPAEPVEEAVEEAVEEVVPDEVVEGEVIVEEAVPEETVEEAVPAEVVEEPVIEENLEETTALESVPEETPEEINTDSIEESAESNNPEENNGNTQE
ncbi:MAG: hypothetical protein IJP12_02570 [Methanobrevibacter sp.]|nr:hypothetical protein [Methanobrevibacter sp.]